MLPTQFWYTKTVSGSSARVKARVFRGASVKKAFETAGFDPMKKITYSGHYIHYTMDLFIRSRQIGTYTEEARGSARLGLPR